MQCVTRLQRPDADDLLRIFVAGSNDSLWTRGWDSYEALYRPALGDPLWPVVIEPYESGEGHERGHRRIPLLDRQRGGQTSDGVTVPPCCWTAMPPTHLPSIAAAAQEEAASDVSIQRSGGSMTAELVTLSLLLPDLRDVRRKLTLATDALRAEPERGLALAEALGLLCRNLSFCADRDHLWDRARDLQQRTGNLDPHDVVRRHSSDYDLFELGESLDSVGWPQPPGAEEDFRRACLAVRRTGYVFHSPISLFAAKDEVRKISQRACELSDRQRSEHRIDREQAESRDRRRKWAGGGAALLTALGLLAGLDADLPGLVNTTQEVLDSIGVAVSDGAMRSIDYLSRTFPSDAPH